MFLAQPKHDDVGGVLVLCGALCKENDDINDFCVLTVNDGTRTPSIDDTGLWGRFER